MVIDTSAVLAILFDEPERRHFAELIEADETRLISAATFLEAALVIESRRGEAAGRELDLFMHRHRSRSYPWTPSKRRLHASLGGGTAKVVTPRH